ncbi:allophanate hydrolase subunit 1 [Methylobacterium sp. Leaf117]|uniref:5-oxoprolinase subunit B family protein n=1 Tax=Methylobacterium sp. Leaf117 TaxID=1736260 RepID=UPI0006F3DCB5|nr:allophanate hydrolase subunit 1 [Methylobacterium sp. Leaf117]KQP82707.1 allophanate hydrolase [Methylobacterium sp. Leaf117]
MSQAEAGADPVRFRDAGETALVVEFGARVDPELNARVLALDAALEAARNADSIPGLRETVPTYRSLMIHYDPLVLDRDTLLARVTTLLEPAGAAPRIGRGWTLPCCYDPALAEDIEAVADWVGRPAAEVADLHTGGRYRVYMYGFAPGFAYLGGLPEALAIPRRSHPRPPHPASAILIGGGLAAVATLPMPTGWYVLGRTPERLFSEARPRSFLVEPGDTLRFEAIDVATFAALDARAARGEIIARADG